MYIMNGYSGSGKDTIGPNYYMPSYESVRSRTKGTKFSKMEIRQEKLSNTKSGPGPGQYNSNMSDKRDFNSNFKYY